MRSQAQKPQLLVRFKKAFDSAFHHFIETEFSQITPSQKYWKTTLGQVKKILVQGKRIRPYLSYLGYKAGGGALDANIINLGIALELVHAFALIHDDIIDRSDERRHVATIHRWAENALKAQGASEASGHFGNSVAILAGDYLLALASRQMLKLRMAEKRRAELLRTFFTMVEELIVGQFHDVLLSNNLFRATTKEVLLIMRIKSGQYTVEYPLRLGSMLATSSATLKNTYSLFGVPLGIGFQIRDDILGSFGQDKATGKSLSSDIREGKATLLAVHALRAASRKDKSLLMKVLGNPQANESQIKKVKSIFLATKADAFAKRIADEHLNKALSVLQRDKKISKRQKQDFFDIASYLLERDS